MGDSAMHAQNFWVHQPPHQTHWVSSLVAWDSNVHTAGESESHSDGRQIDVRRLSEGLAVSPGICQHQKSWLPEVPEGCLDLVNQGIGVASVLGDDADMRASLRSSSDLWCKRHLLFFCRYAVLVHSQGWGHLFGSWCKEFKERLLRHLRDHQKLWTWCEFFF